VAIVVFLIAMAIQWPGVNAVVSADSAAYISSGVNLLREGRYENLMGVVETTFPPGYPVLIGAFSLGGRIAADVVARVIAVASSIASLLLLARVVRPAGADGAAVGPLAAIALALLPSFQLAGGAALSQATATAFSLAACYLWIQLPRTQHVGASLGLGALVGAGVLTRPECLLLLPMWALFDLWRQPDWPTVKRYALSAAALAAVIAPYSLWLSLQLGYPTLTGKADATLTQGRRDFAAATASEPGIPAGAAAPTPDLGTEVRRYVYNWGRIGHSFGAEFRVPWGGALPALALAGLWHLRRHGRLLWGLASQGVFLAVLAMFTVRPIHLYPLLPMLAAGIATAGLELARAWRVHPSWMARATAAAGLVAACLTMAEAGTRYSRWAMSEVPARSILREAGVWLREAQPAGGTVYEVGATVAYYADRRSQPLWAPSLDALLARVDAEQPPGEPGWIVVSTLHTFEPSLGALLADDAAHARLRRVAAIDDSRGRCVVWQILPRV
jgi:4-amino-4-deoxy-L-arabinose transferase-like glycosyltransferase